MTQQGFNPSGRRILVVGTCQAGGLSACLGLFLPESRVSPLLWKADGGWLEAALEAVADADMVVTCAPQALIADLIQNDRFDQKRWLKAPMLVFSGFHPDLIQIAGPESLIPGASGAPYHSRIGLWCWRQGLSPADAAALFTTSTMEGLGYHRTWPQAVADARAIFARTELPFAETFLPLQASGRVFMHTPNHPTLAGLAALARSLARCLGAREDDLMVEPEGLIPDALLQNAVWPVYPGVGEALGVPTSLIWKYGHSYYDLPRYLDAQFAALDAAEGPVVCAQADTPHFDAAMRRAMAA